MPSNHFLNTPEALLGRNDSKNPATTCRGITGTGRPCRRALALNKNADNGSSSIGGVVALFKQDSHIADAQYYCWQHKDQADAAIHDAQGITRPSRRETEILQLKNRSSIDTLVQRLGIEAEEDVNEQQRPHQGIPAQRRPRPQTQSRKQTPSFWQSLCCMFVVDHDDTLEIVRHRKRVEQARVGKTASMPTRPHETVPMANRVRPSTQPDRSSPISLIPPNTSPQIASNILAEVSKPLSIHDEEGYIYMFWLTPSDRQGPEETTAKALLSPNAERPGRARRISDVLTEYSYNGDQDRRSRNTILLKIGRANNVTRRMNEWQRQCGHQLNLIRWYPYASSSPLPSPEKAPATQPLYPDLSQHGRPSAIRRTSSNVRKVPNVKRVERLIHLELADQQAKQLCEACGREHREWFKVDASESGIRKVDAIVRRWVEWSESAS